MDPRKKRKFSTVDEEDCVDNLILKKRKIDVENRVFNDAWTDRYLFIMPTRTHSVPKFKKM